MEVGCNPTVPTTEINLELNKLDALLNSLSSEIDTLEEKTSSVCSQPDLKDDPEPMMPSPNETMLGRTLNTLAYRLDVINDRIRSMNNRIAL